ncbi:hypothetical protein HOK51_11260 [Candidatus Woesearchaeota archaeon]|jgi:hypothetical protein|nr:hypothetical protein [Candidatus Woesearchaeota archaeon]MBT6520401.1 hypothetical protein [Candidatus Woesearchaeota archaeon]MBT7368927.1 hypothetical protein [Candidatus Woesearchaeota archaeon]
MANDFQRNIAFKVRINDILTRPFFKQEGFESDYVDFTSHKISRVNIMGVIISTSQEEGQVSFNNFILDDGSGRISLRTFDQNSNIKAEIGDMVQIVGRIREFGSERYIVPETINKVSPDWIKVRNKELDFIYENFYVLPELPTQPTTNQPINQSSSQPQTTQANNTINSTNSKSNLTDNNSIIESDETVMDSIQDPKTPTNTTNDPIEIIIKFIRELDDGRGASFENIVEKSKLDNAESLLKNLMINGEIFEITPGKYKVLE